VCSCPAHNALVDCECQCDHTNDRLAQWHDRALTAEAEIARLRAGEDDERPDPGTALTPAQWIRKWNDAAPDRRLHAAQRVLEVIDQESRCFQQDHDGRLEHLEAELSSRIGQHQRAVNRATAAEGEVKRPVTYLIDNHEYIHPTPAGPWPFHDPDELAQLLAETRDSIINQGDE
jgi:hypothetical protein